MVVLKLPMFIQWVIFMPQRVHMAGIIRALIEDLVLFMVIMETLIQQGQLLKVQII